MTLLNDTQERRYTEKVRGMTDEEFCDEVQRVGFLAARLTNYSEYDQKCAVLSQANPTLYDAAYRRLERSLR